MVAEGFRQGVLGLAHDLISYRAVPWGFDPHEVTAPTVCVYGVADQIVTPAHAARRARRSTAPTHGTSGDRTPPCSPRCGLASSPPWWAAHLLAPSTTPPTPVADLTASQQRGHGRRDGRVPLSGNARRSRRTCAPAGSEQIADIPEPPRRAVRVDLDVQPRGRHSDQVSCCDGCRRGVNTGGRVGRGGDARCGSGDRGGDGACRVLRVRHWAEQSGVGRIGDRAAGDDRGDRRPDG